jgi:hypothetical protein
MRHSEPSYRYYLDCPTPLPNLYEEPLTQEQIATMRKLGEMTEHKYASRMKCYLRPVATTKAEPTP